MECPSELGYMQDRFYCKLFSQDKFCLILVDDFNDSFWLVNEKTKEKKKNKNKELKDPVCVLQCLPIVYDSFYAQKRVYWPKIAQGLDSVY